MINSVKPFRLGLAFHCDMVNAAISINKSVTDRDRQTEYRSIILSIAMHEGLRKR